MNNFSIQNLILTVTVSVFFFQQSFAQDLSGKEVLYTTFLQECVGFKKRPNVQEVWVVNFWAGWHNKSLENIAPLKTLHTHFKNKPVRFVSLSIDKIRLNWEKARQRHQMPWEHVIIPRTEDYDFLKNAFRHNSLPGLFIVNSKGMVSRMRNMNELKNQLENMTYSLPNTPYYEQPGIPKPAPAGTTDWIFHTVKKGDTLYSLYRRYGVKVEEIKKLNGLKSNELRVGQKLKVKKV